jgi:hypothetical protein
LREKYGDSVVSFVHYPGLHQRCRCGSLTACAASTTTGESIGRDLEAAL